jgi:hypothetical protein
METVQPAVIAVKATAQTLKDKLVSTAEDMLRQQQVKLQTPSAPPSGPATIGASPIVKSDAATVKKVIFPRIEKPT